MRISDWSSDVCSSDLAGRFGSLFTGANYAAAKGAIQAMTVQIAHEFGPMGITCNAVCPGVILTERVDRLLASRQTPQQRRQIIETIPVRRHGKVDDVAASIAFLAANEIGRASCRERVCQYV